ncbi:MAG: hypothetical protein V4550_00900 [Gemmatimonadota bacterium]
MTGAHLHLLINHVPILGAILAVLLLLVSRWYGGEILARTALVLLVVVGLAGTGAKYTGEPAEDAVRGLPGITRAAIHEHEEMADTAFLAAVAVALVSAGILARWRREPIPGAAFTVALLGSLAVSGLMAYTGLLGGQVRHTEVRPGATPADASAIEAPRARPSSAVAP